MADEPGVTDRVVTVVVPPVPTWVVGVILLVCSITAFLVGTVVMRQSRILERLREQNQIIERNTQTIRQLRAKEAIQVREIDRMKEKE